MNHRLRLFLATLALTLALAPAVAHADGFAAPGVAIPAGYAALDTARYDRTVDTSLASVGRFYGSETHALGLKRYAPAAVGPDPAGFLRRVGDWVGMPGIGVVLAHEMGHAMQDALGNAPADPLTRELQADCFVGVWLGWDEMQTTDPLTMEDIVLRVKPLLLAAGDPAGTPAAERHGTGEQRLAAAEFGFTNSANGHGLQPCLTRAAELPGLGA